MAYFGMSSALQAARAMSELGAGGKGAARGGRGLLGGLGDAFRQIDPMAIAALRASLQGDHSAMAQLAALRQQRRAARAEAQAAREREGRRAAALEQLGYSKAQINAMRPEEASQLVFEQAQRPFARDGIGLASPDGPALDPERLAMSQALLEGDYDSAARMAQHWYMPAAENERPTMVDQTQRRRAAQRTGRLFPAEGRAQAGPSAGTISEGDTSPAGRAGRRYGPAVAEEASRMGFKPRRSARPGDYDISTAREALRARLGRGEGLNGVGYVRQPGDRFRLARLMYSESHELPGDDAAIGWSTINRVGREGFQPTLEEVIHAPGQFAVVAEGSPDGRDHRFWIESEHPERLTGARRARWIQADKMAEGILSGEIPDPTGGATRFFADTDFDINRLETAPRSYRRDIRSGRIKPSVYESTATGPNRQYFWHETAPVRPLRRPSR